MDKIKNTYKLTKVIKHGNRRINYVPEIARLEKGGKTMI